MTGPDVGFQGQHEVFELSLLEAMMTLIGAVLSRYCSPGLCHPLKQLFFCPSVPAVCSSTFGPYYVQASEDRAEQKSMHLFNWTGGWEGDGMERERWWDSYLLGKARGIMGV